MTRRKTQTQQEHPAARLAAVLHDTLLRLWAADNPLHGAPEFAALAKIGAVGFERYAHELIALGLTLEEQAVGHTCHAAGCERAVPPRLLMCPAHWFRVPKALRDEVWRHYRPGQERDKRPSPEYLEAARKAIDAVAESERREAEARKKASEGREG